MKFNEILYKTRLEKGLSAKNVADKIGISPRGYRFYESGDRQPNVTKLIKIADVLDVSLDYLTGRKNY